MVLPHLAQLMLRVVGTDSSLNAVSETTTTSITTITTTTTTTTTTTCVVIFGSSRGHSWLGLSRWLSSHLCLLNQLLSVDGHPRRVGVVCQSPYFRPCCCFFGHSPEEVAAESEVGRDHPVLCRDVVATASLGELAERVSQRLERVVEQFVGAPVPQIMKDTVDSVQHVPQERVQSRDGEQIVGVPVSQMWELVVEGVQHVPKKRVHDREQIGACQCSRSRRKLGKLFSLCRGADPRTNRWSRFLWCPRPRRNLRIASDSRSWSCQCP